MKFSVCTAIVLGVMTSVFGQAPYPSSDYITDIQFGQEAQAAKGSDVWVMTWADNDLIYTTYSDGSGFGGKRVSTGYASIRGDGLHFEGQNISSDGVTSGGGASGEKCSGILQVDGIFYSWFRNADNRGHQVQLASSGNYCVNVSWHWTIPELGYMCWVDYGKNYADVPEEHAKYVYCYSPDTTSAYDEANDVVLCRVPKDQITNRNAYEFVEYLDGYHNPHWTSDINNRGSVFKFPGGCNRLDVVYNKPLQRYIMTMRARNKRGGHPSHFSIYEAPQPWGPWRTVYYTDSQPTGNEGWGESQHFPSKWISRDGKTMHLAHAGNDQLNVREVFLTVSTPAPALDERMTDIVLEDSLAASTGNGEVHGGTFGSDGWTSESMNDYIHYILPEGLARTTVEFEAKGFAFGGASRRHFWQIFETPRQSQNDSQNFIMIRFYAAPKDAHVPGEARFRLDGPAFGKKQADKILSWEAGKFYKFSFSWDGGVAQWSRDEKVMGTIHYSGGNIQLRHMYLNGGRLYENFPGLDHVTFRNLIVKTKCQSGNTLH